MLDGSITDASKARTDSLNHVVSTEVQYLLEHDQYELMVRYRLEPHHNLSRRVFTAEQIETISRRAARAVEGAIKARLFAQNDRNLSGREPTWTLTS